MQITQLALQLGYADPSHFVRAFRRWTGQTPSEFRRGLGITRRSMGIRRRRSSSTRARDSR